VSKTKVFDIRTPEQIRAEKAITAALARGVKKALLLHKQTGHPIYVWENGQVVRREAKDIKVDLVDAE